MENLFSLPDFFEELVTKKISFCGTVRPFRKGLLQDLCNRGLGMNKEDIEARVRGNMTTLVRKDK
jgi:hypothetical protein